MHKFIFENIWIVGVVLSRKSCQALFVKVYSQRMIARYYNVHSHIKLFVFDDQRVINVSRHYRLFSVRYFCRSLNNSYSSATAGSAGLEYKHFFPHRWELLDVLEFLVLFWQHPRMWRYVELLRILKPHSINILPEQVLSPQVHGLWKMVDFLILVQPQNILDGRVSRPNEIVIFTGLKELESSGFHGVDNCIVYVSTFRYQEGHEEILDVASS